MEIKVPCQRCQKLIRPLTASKTGGFCMSCVGHRHEPVYTEPARGIGYWYRAEGGIWERFPKPATLVRRDWLPAKSRTRLVQYLRSAPKYCGSWGYSFCRFGCGVSDEVMGSFTFWDGAWVWPEGLAHYVECHDVCLPDEFAERVLSPNPPDMSQVFAFPDAEVNWEYWIEWAGRFRA